MIEKLQTWQRPLPNNPVVVEDMGMDNKSLFEKINELVDAVNELKIKAGIAEECLHPTAKVDPYAEQRKWIGKVCRFFDTDKDDARIGVLSAIQNGMYFIKHTSTAYDYCEPVKPDDDIIYKGNDNE